MTYIFIIYLLALLSVGAYSLFCLRTDGWRKWATPLLFIAMIGSSTSLYVQALGTPKPVELYLGKLPEGLRILKIHYDEGKGIYVWVLGRFATVPISIALPWSKEKAKKIREEEEKGLPLYYDAKKNEIRSSDLDDLNGKMKVQDAAPIQ